MGIVKKVKMGLTKDTRSNVRKLEANHTTFIDTHVDTADTYEMKTVAVHSMKHQNAHI